MNNKSSQEKSGISLMAGSFKASLSLLAMAVSTAALAQAAGDVAEQPVDQGAIADIIVTAQFQSQKLQDTPLAVTATTGEMMAARNQANVADFAAQVPSLYIQSGGAQNGSSATIAIRGIGQSDPTLTLEPGVAVYLDDVYFSTVSGSNFDLLDLDRIEVLRGPQGTLAGKNSIGGALKLYSKKPDNDAGGFVQATYGSYNRAEILASVNVPLVQDSLFLRLSGMGKHKEGFVRQVDYGCAFPASGMPVNGSDRNCVFGKEGGGNAIALRAALRWLPAERVEVNLVGDYANNDDQPQPSINILVDRPKYGLPPLLVNGVPLDSRFQSPDYRTNYATPGLSYLNFGQHNKLKLWGVSGTINVDLGNQLALKSITAFRRTTSFYDIDLGLVPFDISLTDTRVYQNQFTQELRLSGKIDDLFDFTLGGFYFHSKGASAARVEDAFFKFLSDDTNISTSKSLFAHGVMHVADGFDLTAGIRYTRDNKTYSFIRRDPNGGPAFLFGALDGLTNAYKESRFDYRANASYRWSDSLMTYAQFSTGYKGGGSNPRPVFPNQVVSFAPETLQTYEVGVKSDLLGGKLRINLAAFINDYKNIQIFTSTPYFNLDLPVQPDPFQPNWNPVGGTAPAFVFRNAGDARTKGVEAEVTLRPTDEFLINASASYLDFQYKSLSASALASGFKFTDQSPFTPKWKWSVGAQYDIAMPNDGVLVPRLDIAYQSKTYSKQPNDPIDVMGARTLLNGRLTYRPSGRAWEAALSVTNLTDKKYLVNIFDLKEAYGVVTAGVGRPREFAINMKYNF